MKISATEGRVGQVIEFTPWDWARASGCCAALYAREELAAMKMKGSDEGNLAAAAADAAADLSADLARIALETPARTSEEAVAKLALAVDAFDRLIDLGDEEERRSRERIRAAMIDAIRVANRLDGQDLAAYGCTELARLLTETSEAE